MSNIKFLDEEEIFKQLKYLEGVCDTTVNFENPHEISFYIEKLTALFGNASFVMGSAIFNYQTKKSPSTVALRDWSTELNDKLKKRMNAMQSVMNVAKEEKEKSRFQPS